MTRHVARLLDRYLAGGQRPMLRAQRDDGTTLDVRVREEDVEKAAALWGGSYFSFTYRGGRAFFVPRPYRRRTDPQPPPLRP